MTEVRDLLCNCVFPHKMDSADYDTHQHQLRRSLRRHVVILIVAGLLLATTLAGVITVMVLNGGHAVLDYSAAGKAIVGLGGASAFSPPNSKEAYERLFATDSLALWHCHVNLLKDGTPVCLENITMAQTTNWEPSEDFGGSKESRELAGIGLQGSEIKWSSSYEGIFPDQLETDPQDPFGKLTYMVKFTKPERRAHADPNHPTNLGTALRLDEFLVLAANYDVGVVLELMFSSYYLSQPAPFDLVEQTLGAVELVRSMKDVTLTDEHLWFSSSNIDDLERLKPIHNVIVNVFDPYVGERVRAEDVIFGTFRKLLDGDSSFVKDAVFGEGLPGNEIQTPIWTGW